MAFTSPKLLPWTGYGCTPTSAPLCMICRLPRRALGSVTLLGHSPWQPWGFMCLLNNNSHCKGCRGKGCVLPALCVWPGSRFLNMLFLCSPFQVKIQVLPSLSHMHPQWKISTVYRFFSRPIFRTTWTFFFSVMFLKLAEELFFKPAYTARSILK